MNICIFGTGYVGLVTGACLADSGNIVWCVDADNTKIEAIRSGIMPFYEPGLQKLVLANCKKNRLHFTTDASEAMQNAQICYITVGTPSLPDGSSDISYVVQVAETIGRFLEQDMIIVNKSTVPIGTSDLLEIIISRNLSKKQSPPVDYTVISNPEFLREGSAVNDFMEPDRIIIGTKNIKAANILGELYRPFLRSSSSILIMDNKSAEISKYAANAMLATRISFINEIARLCDSIGGDIEQVRLGIGSDPRIGRHFLKAGLGYGGSCFPKDVKELIHCGQRLGVGMEVACAAESVNSLQKNYLVEMVKKRFGANLKGISLALWGLSFKPDTDDMRDAPSIEIIRSLSISGATIHAYDPAALNNAQKTFDKIGISIQYASTMLEAVTGADALLLITEWPQFAKLNLTELRNVMTQSIIFDGRNFYNSGDIKSAGFEYYCIGRGCYVI